jgi:hypothetical protein
MARPAEPAVARFATGHADVFDMAGAVVTGESAESYAN